MAIDKPERLRFSIKDDIILLRAVIAVNPYEDMNMWKEVHEKTVMETGKSYSLRAVKEHVIHLLKLWMRGDSANIRKSGTEEQYTEKEGLLQTVSDMASDFNLRKGFGEVRRTSFSVTDGDIKPIVFSYDSAFGEIQEPSTSFSEEQVPQASEQTEVAAASEQQTSPIRRKRPRAHTLKSSFLNYLHKKQEDDSSLRKNELHLEETKLEIEKKKIELEEKRIKLEEDKWKLEERERRTKLDFDIEEQKLRLQMEMEERKQRLQQTEQQQKLMQLMFHFFTSNNNNNNKCNSNDTV